MRPRGLPRLVFDLDAVDRLTGPRVQPARVRLEAQVGVELLRDLDRMLDLGGALARPARSPRRVRRAA